MKLLREKYKTWEGAHKRARLENSLASGEFARGDKARMYYYRAVRHEGMFRVERFERQQEEVSK